MLHLGAKNVVALVEVAFQGFKFRPKGLKLRPKMGLGQDSSSVIEGLVPSSD